MSVLTEWKFDWDDLDDSIHIASQDDPGLSLCGLRNRRNLAPYGKRPDGYSGCWTCLIEDDKLRTEDGAA